jgi:murein tripeptide amidase MpaA
VDGASAKDRTTTARAQPNRDVLSHLKAEIHRESQFVRVVGELQTYQNAKIVRANNVFAARDPYEIFEHILKAIQETLIYELGPPVRAFLGQYLPF